jgi:sulfatase maturation enzyme AslB (radical SAM superfamily)/SAM-dependent methyltransferase
MKNMGHNNLQEIEKAIWLKEAGVLPPDRSKEYTSCHWIEGGLVFFPGDKIGVCCIPQNGKGEPKFEDFSGDRLPLKQILLKRKQIIYENQNGGYDLCKGCQYLVNKIWPARTSLFDIINLSHFIACNLACIYCFTRRIDMKTYPPDVPTSRVISALKHLMDNNYLAHDANMLFGGGEPALLKGFEELMEMLIDYGTNYHICSNGTVLSKTVLKALQHGNGQLLLGIDAGSRDVYRVVKGKDLFEKVWQNARQYATAGGDKVIAKIIVRDENVNDVHNFVEMARVSGIKRVCYDIDAYQKELNDDVVKAAARVKYECEKLGIKTFMGESGTSTYPENRPGERIDEAYQQFFTPLKQAAPQGKQMAEDNPDMQKHVIGKIHPNDDMLWKSNGVAVERSYIHYNSVGLSALSNIEGALQAANRSFKDVGYCLDLPCGYGRVLRVLQTKIDAGRITACDTCEEAVQFCSSEFGAEPLVSNVDLNKVNFTKSYDLIWVGSLATHIKPQAFSNLLAALYRVLSSRGILVFTTHGEHTYEREDRAVYGVDFPEQSKLIKLLKKEGYSFTPYGHSKEYGISIVLPRYVFSKVNTLFGDNMKLLMYRYRGWDNHQDVYAYQRKQ